MARVFPLRHLKTGSIAVLMLLYWAPTSWSQEDLQVGYAILEADQNGYLPVSMALFSFRNADGVLVSEAGVAAVEPIRRGRIFVDAGIATGLALANPGDSDITATLILRDAAGLVIEEGELPVPAGQHTARFVTQLLGELPTGFLGSLTFETEGAAGLAPLTIRQGRNTHQEALLATLPVVDLDEPETATQLQNSSLVFPHVGAGGIISTQLILINPSSEALSGEIHLVGSDGRPLELQLTPRTSSATQSPLPAASLGSTFSYELSPEGVFQATLTSPAGVVDGYAVVTGLEGSTVPSGTAIFQFRDEAGHLSSEAGVGATPSTSQARIFVDTFQTQTGVAIAVPGAGSTRVLFRLKNLFGEDVGVASRKLAAGGHLAVFARDLFSDLPAGFKGVMEIEAELREEEQSTAFSAVTLKLTFNSRNDPILTTLPVARAEVQVSGRRLIFPQIGFGSGFSTRLVLIDSQRQGATGKISFIQSNGSELVTTLVGMDDSQFDWALDPDGAQQLRPGDPTRPVRLVLDPANPLATEIVVNEGAQMRIRPMVFDENGELRSDFPIDLANLDGQVADVGNGGDILALEAGFSTLVLEALDLVEAGTLTVVRVDQGFPGYGAGDILQDEDGTIFLSSPAGETILRTESLLDVPEVYAGIPNQPGFKDDTRLASLFHDPSAVALDRVTGSLYVADRANHVIRRLPLSDQGQVQTLAGNGEPGSVDGVGSAARFRFPAGVARDDRGNLWIADTGNHTIRRVDLANREVVTVAGSPGQPGFLDGTGATARFNEPYSLAVRRVPVDVQVERQNAGVPPLPTLVLVADRANNAVRVVSEDGSVESLRDDRARSPFGAQGNPDPLRFFSRPRDVASDSFGNIFVTESPGRVTAVLTDGTASSLTQPGTFEDPRGVAVSRGGRVLIADGQNTAYEVIYGTPEIHSLEPNRVTIEGGTEILVKGRNFAPETFVVVGSKVIRDPDVIDSKTLRFISPKLLSGRATLTVQNRGGIAQAPLFVQTVALEDLAPGYITTVAGGTAFVGDGGAAKSAVLQYPLDVTLDGSANLYIADPGAHRIRKVDAVSSLITTVAGNGQFGYSGDGVPAVASRLREPSGVAVSRNGDLYIHDTANGRIRMVEAETGIIRTLLETSAFRPLLRAFGRTLTVDPQNRVFFCEPVLPYPEMRLRFFDPTSGETTEIADTCSRPTSDSEGNIYWIDGDVFPDDEETESRILRWDPASGATTRIATVGGFVSDIAVGPAGHLYVGFRGQVLRYNSGGGISRRYSIGTNDYPKALAVDSAGNIHVVLQANEVHIGQREERSYWVRRITSDGFIETEAGTGEVVYGEDGEPAIGVQLNSPTQPFFDADGNLYLLDAAGALVRRVDRATGLLETVAGNGQLPNQNQVFAPDEIAATETPLFDLQAATAGESGEIFLAESQCNCIRRVDLSSQTVRVIAGNNGGGFSGDGGPATDALLSRPGRNGGMVFLNEDLYFVQDGFYSEARIRRIDLSTGRIDTVAGGNANDCCADLEGPASQASIGRGRAFVFSFREAPGQLFVRLVYDRTRYDGLLWSIDVESGTGHDTGILLPNGVFPIDALGNRLMTPSLSHQMFLVDPEGESQLLFGRGGCDIRGDNRPAAEENLCQSGGVAFDSKRNLYVADSPNSTIRAIRGPIP